MRKSGRQAPAVSELTRVGFCLCCQPARALGSGILQGIEIVSEGQHCGARGVGSCTGHERAN